MFTSMQKLALSVTTAALFSPLCVSVETAQASPDRALRPTRTVERITPRAVQVVSTSNYQVALPLNCYAGATTCWGDLPVVRPRRRLNLTRISCWMTTATYSKFTLGQVDLRRGDTSLTLVSVLPADYSTDFGYHSLNRAVDIHIQTGHHVRILLDIASGGQTNASACTAHGTLDVLE
jgi:hypothetical protein